MTLENEQSDKLRQLRQLEHDYSETMRFQKDQQKAMKVLRQSGQYEKKFSELNIELKQAKDHYRKLQLREREDQNLMQQYHESIIKLEGQQRKLN